MTEKPPKPWKAEAVAELQLLRTRLRAEAELDLLAKLDICQKPIDLFCTICRFKISVPQKCKRKWCPCCARQLAARKTSELRHIVAHMRWPLFVTLTMQNSSAISFVEVRKLRRAFGKLRHRKLWTNKVVGGIASIEITNIGNGWHPHLHAVIDCQWLAHKSPAPRRTDDRETKIAKYKAAAVELHDIWAKLLGQPTASIKVKRAARATITEEVVKYSVKGSDLIACNEPIGNLIRALDSTRLMTTFGTAHGQKVRDIRIAARAKVKAERDEFLATTESRCQCGEEEFQPANVIEMWDNRDAARKHKSR